MSAARGVVYVIPRHEGDPDVGWDTEVVAAARVLASAHGLDVVLVLPESSIDPGTQLAWLEAMVRADAPRFVLGADVIPGPGDLLRRLAARTGLIFLAGVTGIGPAHAAVRSRDGGEVSYELPQIMACLPGCARPQVRQAGPLARRTQVRLMPFPSTSVVDEGAVSAFRRDQPLEEAELILCAGNGVRDWHAFHELAALLDAAEGASRVVCDSGLMPRGAQIGSSGIAVRARCYIAFGVSGAPQHLEGIEQCVQVIAVNSDAQAQMMRRADLGIVADAQAVMRELLLELRARREA